jgi:uroporphyrinogen decarboxylase
MATEDPAAIEEEIRTKIPVAKRGGGYIYHSDHSIPNDVSFARYQRVLELVREYGRY